MNDLAFFLIGVAAVFLVLFAWDAAMWAVEWLNDQGASIAPLPGPEDFA